MGIRYNPALDGLRAVAVLAVIGKHTYAPGFTEGGTVGVGLFFVLSGYLITRVLADNPDLPAFYMRRVRRLVPALAFMLAFYLLLAPLAWPDYAHHGRDALATFFYLTDYTEALKGWPEYLGHTWSLSVEEHFYLLWPLVFVTLRPSKRALAGAVVIAALWAYSCQDLWQSYHRFDTRCTGLLIGCLLAHVPRDRIPAWPGMVALAAICYVGASQEYHPAMMLAVDLASGVVVIGRLPDWLTHRWLVHIGKLSYGIYLWQTPISRWMFGWYPWWEGALVVTLLGSFAMASLSYYTVERAFRHKREPAGEPVPA